MEELEYCYDLRGRIKKLEERIEDISWRIRYPKTFAFSDMPRGTAKGTNQLESYIIRKEQLEEEKKRLEAELQDSWDTAKHKLIACNATIEERNLMYLRFHAGHTWKTCAAKMQKRYGTSWNENKVFRTYRNIVKKHKETL